MFELVTDVELKVDTGEGVEVFKLKRRRVGKKENKAFKKWAKEEEKRNADLDAITTQKFKKSKELKRLKESLSDIRLLLNAEDDKKEIVRLVKEKRELENRIYALEDEIEADNKKSEEIENKLEKLQEAAALKSFELLLVQDDEAKRLKEFASEYGINLADLLFEINRIIKKKKEKK